MFVSLFGFVLIADLERRMGANAGRKYRQKIDVCAESTLFGLFRSDPSFLCQNKSSERGERRETASARSAFGLRHFNDPRVQMRGS